MIWLIVQVVLVFTFCERIASEVLGLFLAGTLSGVIVSFLIGYYGHKKEVEEFYRGR